MLTVDSSNRIRLSRSETRKAGFHPGLAVAVVPTDKNSFSIVPLRKVTKGSKMLHYSVEKDGRMRVSIPAIRDMGVRNSSRRSNYSVTSTRGSIIVTM
jgi:hypothetical protein